MNFFGTIINPYGMGVVTALLLYLPAAFAALTLAALLQPPVRGRISSLHVLHGGLTSVMLVALVLVVFYVPSALRDSPVTQQDYANLISLLNWVGGAALLAGLMVLGVSLFYLWEMSKARARWGMLLFSAMLLQALIGLYGSTALTRRAVQYTYTMYNLPDFTTKPIWWDYVVLGLWQVLGVGVITALLILCRRRSSGSGAATWWQWLLYGFASMSYWPVDPPGSEGRSDDPEDGAPSNNNRT